MEDELDLFDFPMYRILDVYLQPLDGDKDEAVQKYVKQIRQSGGYDVNFTPPPERGVLYPCWPADPRRMLLKKGYYDLVMRGADLAIREINKETGETYELVEVEKIVEAVREKLLLTITARQLVPFDPDLVTFQVTVEVLFGGVVEIFEWRFKPITTGALEEDVGEAMVLKEGGTSYSDIRKKYMQVCDK